MDDAIDLAERQITWVCQGGDGYCMMQCEGKQGCLLVQGMKKWIIDSGYLAGSSPIGA